MNATYIKGINSHKIISFDIFDTLLKRNIRNPSDLFIIIEKEYNKYSLNKINNFYTLRKNAERKSKESATTEEITLDSIYKYLPYDDSTKTKLKEIELSIEEAFLMPNYNLQRIYDYAIKKGKEVILVSDMYLPQSFLERILKKLGYTQYHKLYVSSTYGITKRSGNLFQFILKENNYTPQNILHIGDAKRSDWLMPRKYGIHTLHIKTYTNKLLYKQNKYLDINQNILSTFINNTTPKHCRYEQIGYETLGPVLVGFCLWLEHYRIKYKLDKLLFFSRDGQIMSKAYQLLYPQTPYEYIYTSRRSLVVPLICLQNGINEIFDIIPFYRYVTIKTLIERLGIDYDCHKLTIEKYGFNEKSSFTKKEYLENPQFIQLFHEIESEIYQNSKEELKGFKEYITKYLAPQIGIVDIGWKGTMQNTLTKIFNKINMDSNVLGFYLGILSNTTNTYGYYFDPNRKENENILMSFSGLFETIFSADHGSVERYKKDGSIQLYDFEYNKNEECRQDYKIIQSIQKGALKFVQNYSKSSIKDFIKWDADLAFYRILILGMNPQKIDLKILGDIHFFDHEIIQLAHPSSFIIFRPYQLKKELSSAQWKIGYLKRLLKIKLPYFTIYKAIRKFYK